MRAAFQAFREAITPTLKTSQFMEGRLTPEEFVESGDALIRAFPTFQWLRVAPENRKSYLPADKQCLVMCDVASRARVADIQKGAEEEAVMENEDGWVASASATAAAEDMYDDLDSYRDSSVCTTAAADVGLAGNGALEMRLYNLYILYDTYYACPRAYLTGRLPNGTPLLPDQMMEDIMQDYIDKTATIERFPFSPDILTVSVHPCRHAQTMKRILEGMSVRGDGNVTLTVVSYMPAFLKMLASMLPTLEYDYTAAVRL